MLETAGPGVPRCCSPRARDTPWPGTTRWPSSRPPDRFLQAVREIQQGIIADELHHGLQEVERLAHEAPSPDAVAAILPLIRHVGALCVRQRNEQFGHPLAEAEIAALERELEGGTIPPIELYRQAVAVEA